MVDLAKNAFSTKNFGLAAEIYERTIIENGPKVDLYLGLADSFARCGNFEKAFEVYSAAFRLGRVGQENLKHLVNSLIDTVKQERKDTVLSRSCMFSCTICRGLYSDPVTIPCGHTYCRKCLDRDPTRTCKICGVVHYRLKISSLKSNILLSKLIEKWFGNENKAAELKAKGNEHFEKRNFTKAIEFYTEAISLDNINHLLLSNRCHALISSDRFSEALSDAEEVLTLRPDWPKGYYRKGCALYGLGRYEDAVVAFLQCLALDSSVSTAREQLAKALHHILSSLPPDDPKRHAMQTEMNPSLLQSLIRENFNSSILLPQLTIDSSIQHLQTIISETIASAENFNTAGGAPSSHEQGPSSYCDNSSLSDEQSGLAASSSSSDEGVPSHGAGRKRGRILSQTQTPTSPTSSVPQKFLKSDNESLSKAVQLDVRDIPVELLNKDDLECALCYRMFYEPVTTPCGHVYCKKCLERSLDHQSICPLCKSSLVEYLAERRQSVTESIQNILEHYFPQEFVERKEQHEAEITELAKMGFEHNEVPIFVCTVGYPSVPCPLHIFEPRYRLMIRQCMESGTRQFGMCMHTAEDSYSDVGCMLEIREVQFFPDGRSILDTVGGRRFRVLSRSRRDGYNIARVEFLKDVPIEPSDLEEVLQLQAETYEACKEWFNKLSVMHRHKITSHFGDFPPIDPAPQLSTNGPHWAWWLTAILPLDPQVQQTLLAMISFKERLQALKKILNFVSKKQSH